MDDTKMDDIFIKQMPTFGEIYASHNITVKELADNAGVTKSIVTLMIQGTAVYSEFAVKVLSALSAMTQNSYALDTVDVEVTSVPAESLSEVACLRKQIDLENAAAQSALKGFAFGNTKHEFISKRMELIASHTEELSKLVGSDNYLCPSLYTCHC